MGLRSDQYHNSAWERIAEARFLHDHGYYVLAMYLSGLAVECMLRAFRILKNSTFMEALEQKVKGILLEFFAEHEVQLEINSDGRLSGFLISDKFTDMDHLTRQHKIWGLLRKKITKSERAKILGFIAFTPTEHEAYSEPSI